MFLWINSVKPQMIKSAKGSCQFGQTMATEEVVIETTCDVKAESMIITMHIGFESGAILSDHSAEQARRTIKSTAATGSKHKPDS